MANRYPKIVGSRKISDDYDTINEMIDMVEEDVDSLQSGVNKADTDIANHKASNQAHDAASITYNGKIQGAKNSEEAIDYVDNRLDNAIIGSGEGRDPELSDIKIPDPSYTPARTINVAGDIVRDMQKQFSEQLADIVINVRSFGVVGDGIADDTSAFQAAADYARNVNGRLYGHPSLVIRITSPVNLRYIRYIEILSTIVIDFSDTNFDYALLGGDSSGQSVGVKLSFSRIINNAENRYSLPSLRLVGIKNAEVNIKYCTYLQLYADYRSDTTSSIAYCNFMLGREIFKLELYGEPGGTSWINENNFYGGRFSQIRFAGGYHHNNNVFYKPCLESSTVPGGPRVDFEVGTRNQLLNMRSENATSINFGIGTSQNVIIDAYNTNPSFVDGNSIVLSDLGFDNLVTSLLTANGLRREVIVEINPSSLIFNGTGECKGFENITRPGIRNMVATQFRTLYETGIIPVNKVKRFRVDTDQAVWRWRVYCYDANMVPLTDKLYLYPSGGWSVVSDSYMGFITSVGSRWIVVGDPNVAYVNIQMYYYGPGQFSYASLSAYVHPSDEESRRLVNSIRKRNERPLSTASSPTYGLAHPGQTVAKTTGGVFTCVFRKDSTTSSATSSGSTSLSVSDASGILVGDVIGVEISDGSTHWRTVSAVSGNTVTMSSSVSNLINIGANAVFLRWV